MFSKDLLLLPSYLPSFVKTFGASTTLLSPIFNLLLLSVAVVLILSLLNNTQPNSWIRNVFAGYGALSMFSSLLDLFNTNNNSPYQPVRQYAPPPRGQYFFQNEGCHHHPNEYPMSRGNQHTHFSESSNHPERNHHQHPSQSPSYNFHGHA